MKSEHVVRVYWPGTTVDTHRFGTGRGAMRFARGFHARTRGVRTAQYRERGAYWVEGSTPFGPVVLAVRPA